RSDGDGGVAAPRGQDHERDSSDDESPHGDHCRRWGTRIPTTAARPSLPAAGSGASGWTPGVAGAHHDRVSHTGAAILDDLAARGLIHDSTDLTELRSRLAEGPITLYFGCDPSADSLHAGNLVGLLVLRRFQLAGHRP